MAKAKKPQDQEVADNCFENDGKTFRVIIHAVQIPGVGVRTAAEICHDEEAQQALIEANCIGSVLEEVV